MKKEKYYVAYGSNLNIEQMEWRCPDAQIVGTGYLNGYELMFKGSKTGSYATVERKKNMSVPVGVWSISDNDEKKLDRYEGYPSFYYKRDVIVTLKDGRKLKCLVYIMHEDRLIGEPTPRYVQTCLQGYRDFGLDANAFSYAYLRSVANIGRMKYAR